jgi:branched-chain amino acid transport system ATP-binding protein
MIAVSTILQTEGVWVRYGNVRALNEVAVRVDQGQIHGIIGPNGAGKSTLMSVLSGAQRPTGGRVLFDGQDITGRPVRWRRRRGISRSFQRTSIFPAMTVGEQLALVSCDDSAHIRVVADAFGLAGLLDRRADTISYGDQRRVDIALAVVGRSRLLLLDEPAAGLTAQETADLFGHVTALARDEGLSALIVEHDVEAVFGSCDIVTVLDLGEVVMSDEPATVRTDVRVIRAYLGTAA